MSVRSRQEFDELFGGPIAPVRNTKKHSPYHSRYLSFIEVGIPAAKPLTQIDSVDDLLSMDRVESTPSPTKRKQGEASPRYKTKKRPPTASSILLDIVMGRNSRITRAFLAKIDVNFWASTKQPELDMLEGETIRQGITSSMKKAIAALLAIGADPDHR